MTPWCRLELDMKDVVMNSIDHELIKIQKMESQKWVSMIEITSPNLSANGSALDFVLRSRVNPSLPGLSASNLYNRASSGYILGWEPEGHYCNTVENQKVTNSVYKVCDINTQVVVLSGFRVECPSVLNPLYEVFVWNTFSDGSSTDAFSRRTTIK